MIKACVYLLYSDEGSQIYVGSTQNSLQKRLSAHKTAFKRWKCSKSSYMSSFKIFESYKIVKIKILEDRYYDNRNELAKSEGFYILRMNSVNDNIAGRSIDEWRRVKITCTCGRIVGQNNLKTHKKTEIHKK